MENREQGIQNRQTQRRAHSPVFHSRFPVPDFLFASLASFPGHRVGRLLFAVLGPRPVHIQHPADQ